MIEPRLSADEVKRLMRQHKATIRALAQNMQITMKRVREVREKGLTGPAVRDWVEAITTTRATETSRPSMALGKAEALRAFRRRSGPDHRAVEPRLGSQPAEYFADFVMTELRRRSQPE